MDAWYRDRAALSLIASRYVPWLAALSLAWEIAQLPLYTIWREASPGYLAFAVAHCTVGDVLIGVACLALALVLGGERTIAQWHWRRIIPVAVILAVSYTSVSEWLNTALARWTYSEFMPVVTIGSLRFGLSPLAQWLVVVPIAVRQMAAARAAYH